MQEKIMRNGRKRENGEEETINPAERENGRESENVTSGKQKY